MSEVLPDVGTPRPYALVPRLIALELRKCVDTRVMRWVLWLLVLLMGAVITLNCVYDARTSSATSASLLLSVLATLGGLPLGVISILIMSSDWTTRNTHVYFPRVRSRGAVFVAKLCTVVTVVVGFAVSCLALIVVGFAIVRALGHSPNWDFTWARIAVFVAVLLNGAVVGAAVASVLRSVPASIVLIFSTSLLGLFVLSLNIPDPVKLAFSTDTHLRPLLEPHGYGGAQFLPDATPLSVVVSLLLWIVGPLTAGAWLNSRAEA